MRSRSGRHYLKFPIYAGIATLSHEVMMRDVETHKTNFQFAQGTLRSLMMFDEIMLEGERLFESSTLCR